MNKFHNLFLVLFLCMVAIATHSKPWQVLVYMDSSDSLSHAAVKNITDLVKARTHNHDDTISIKIQLHCLGAEDALSSEVYRYSVQGNALIVHEYGHLTYNPVNDLVSAAQWAFDGNQDAYTMLIMWNHGSGVLNKTWQNSGTGFDWQPEFDDLMTEACSFKRGFEHTKHRGLMFLKEPKIYMSLSQFGQAIDMISTTVLQGRKIDILGMDMCMMSMVEVGYEVAPYVHYLIGSQDCELEYGWDYAAVFSDFAATTTPVDVANSVVQAYKHFYTLHAKRGTYTHAATDLSYINDIKQNVDDVAQLLIEYSKTYGDGFISMVKELRKQLPMFCMIPMYTDLYTFYESIEEILVLYDADVQTQTLALLLEHGKHLIKQAVVANCAGEQRAHVKGLSIYLPLSHLDSSYQNSLFGKCSTWVGFIKEVIK